MRGAVLLGVLILAVGCKSTLGPKANREKTRDPLLTTEDQQRYARERYSIVEENRNVAPNVGLDRYGPTGR